MPTFRFSSLRNRRLLSVSGYLLGVLVLVSAAVLLRPWTLVNAQQPTPFTTVAAASYRADAIAPQSIVAGFGQNLATQTLAGRDTDPNTAGVQLPTTLAGTTVRVNNVPAPLFFVSPGQINYQIPANTPLGNVTVQVSTQSGATSAGTINVRQVAPAVFTANADGAGVPASVILRVAASGAQTYESIFTQSTQANRFLATPINLGPEGERVFLILYLSGIRGVPDPNNDGNFNEFVRTIINGIPITPAYAGIAPGFVGLEQLNVEIPRTLLGSAALDVQVFVNGFGVSNTTGIELVAPPVTALSFRALGLPNRTVRTFATIGSYLFAGTNLGVWGSADNGTNWINLSTGLPPNSDIRSLIVDGETIYAGLGNGGGACVSYNRGQSWTAINAGLSGSTLTFNNLLFFNGILWAATQGGVCRYNGTTWEARNNSLGTLDSATLLVSGGRLCVGTRGGGIYVLGNGSVWGAINTGLPTGAQVLSLANVGSAVFAGLNGGGLCISRNGGASWTQVAGGFPASGIVNSIWADGTRVYAGTGTGVYVSNDSGTNWNPLNTGLAGCSGANITNIVQTVASRLLAGSTGCGVYGSALAAGPNNRAPVAYDQTVQFTEDTPIVISLSGFDADLDPLTYSIVAGPARGSLNGAVPNITYTPDTNFNGRTAFTFRVTDGRQFSNTATISLEGRPINDAPVLTVPGAQTVSVNQALTFTVSATDPDAGQAVTLSASGLPSGATFNAATGAFAWTPTVAGGYTLTFTATDNGTPVLQHTRTVSVTVNPPQGNRPPVANAQSVQTNEDTARQITLTGSDADNNPLTYSIVTQPTKGVLSGTAPNVTYTPTANTNGSDSFTFKVNDGTVDSPTATVSINITPVNDAPTLVLPGPISVTAGQNINFKLDVSDPDRAEQSYTYASNNLPSGATLTADQGGKTATFNWTPGTNGTTTINFTVTDSGNLSDTKALTITASGPSPVGNWINIKGNLAATFNAQNASASNERIFVSNYFELHYAALNGANISGNWTAFNNGLPITNQNYVDYQTVIGNKIYVSLYRLGLFVSDVSTANFTKIGAPSYTQGSTTYYLTPNFIVSFNGALYASFSQGLTGQNSIYVSTDEGVTWTQPANGGLPAFGPTDYAIVGNTLYVLTEGTAIYRTTNGGISWTRIGDSLPASGNTIYGLAANGATLFCGSFGGGTTTNGIYRSTNGGNSWTRLTSDAPFLTNLTYEFEVINGIIFASVGNSPVYFSADNGTTWQAMNAGAAPQGGQVTNLFPAGGGIAAVAGGTNNPVISVLPSPATNRVPQLTVPGAQTATVGTQLSFQISATDADDGQTLTYQANSLPPGATFGTNSRTFNWTPAVAGIFTVGFVVTDSGTPALSQNKTVQITVSAPASSPGGFWQQTNTGLQTAKPIRYWATASNKLFGATDDGKVYRLDASGWVNTSSGIVNESNATVNSIGFASNGTNLYLLTLNGLFRSTDQGATWTKPANATYDVPVGLSSGLGVSGNTIFVSTQQYQAANNTLSTFMLRSTDGGVNWQKVGVGLVQAMYSIQPLGNTVVTGSFSYLYRSTNNGGNFASIINPNIRNFAVAGQTLFAAAETAGVYRSVNNGVTWTQVNTGLPTSPYVRSVHYTAPYLFAATSEGVYYSLDLGASWQTINNGESPINTLATQVYDGKVYVTTGESRYGSPNTAYSGVYVSPLPTISGNAAPTITVNDTYTGTTGAALNFTVTANAADSGQTVTLAASNLPQGATFTPATGAFAWTPQAAGTYTVSFNATDNGTPALTTIKNVTLTVTGNAIIGNWSNITGGGLPLNLSISQIAEYDGEVFISTNTGVYKTNNGGQSWTRASSGLGSANGGASMLVNVNNTLYATGTSTARLYASTDGGASWEVLGTGNTAPTSITSVVYAGNTLIASNSQNVYLSTNFGQTWATTATGLGTNNYLSKLVLKGTSVFGTSTYPYLGNAGVYRSDNNGAAWTAAGSGLAANAVYQNLLVKGNDVLALTNQTPIYRTTNNGTSWAAITTTGLPSQAIYELATNGTLIFAGGAQGTYFSSDNGATWTEMTVGDNVTSARSFAIVGTKIYATTTSGVFVSPIPGTN